MRVICCFFKLFSGDNLLFLLALTVFWVIGISVCATSSAAFCLPMVIGLIAAPILAVWITRKENKMEDQRVLLVQKNGKLDEVEKIEEELEC